MADKETRISLRAGLEARTGDTTGHLEGYAATFNTLSKALPQGFKEKISPMAFSRALAEKQDVLAKYNHAENSIPLGRTKSGTLKLATDSKGLKFDIALDPNQVAHRDLWQAVRRGDIADCSFAFAVNGDGEDWEDGDDCPVRTLKDVNLFDVSVVNHPAYPGTSVSARAMDFASRFLDRVPVHLEARRLMHKYPELCLEDLIRFRRLGYSQDLMNELRMAAIAKEIRQGITAADFDPGPQRGGGQAEDPQSLLRCGETARTAAEHGVAAQRHRNAAHRAKSLQAAEKHFHAGNRHALAQADPSDVNSLDARNASRYANGVR